MNERITTPLVTSSQTDLATTAQDASTVIVNVEQLCKSFGDHQVLRGIDLTVRKGQVVSILGKSGGGKSTLLRCMNLLETPSSGS